MKTILTIAGGGFMGIGPARYLMELERWFCSKAITYQIDGIACTSVGALIGSLLAAGYSGLDVYEIMAREMPGVFRKRGFPGNANPFSPRYPDSNIDPVLEKYLGDKLISDAVKPIWITSYDARKKQAKVFGPDDHVTLCYAARCSMAAPTYFAPVDGRYVDGGLMANDPALVGVAGMCREYDIDAEDIRCLSLVTTGHNAKEGRELKSSWSVIGWSSVILDSITSGNSADVEFMCRRILKAGYERICPEMKDYKLDDISKSGEVEDIWLYEYEKNGEQIAAWLVGGDIR